MDRIKRRVVDVHDPGRVVTISRRGAAIHLVDTDGIYAYAVGYTDGNNRLAGTHRKIVHGAFGGVACGPGYPLILHRP